MRKKKYSNYQKRLTGLKLITQFDLNALVHAVYPLRKSAYLQIYSFQQDLTQESPPRKFSSVNDLLPASQATILPLSLYCLYLSNLDYAITHSSLFSSHISGTAFFSFNNYQAFEGSMVSKIGKVLTMMERLYCLQL